MLHVLKGIANQIDPCFAQLRSDLVYRSIRVLNPTIKRNLIYLSFKLSNYTEIKIASEWAR